MLGKRGERECVKGESGESKIKRIRLIFPYKNCIRVLSKLNKLTIIIIYQVTLCKRLNFETKASGVAMDSILVSIDLGTARRS